MGFFKKNKEIQVLSPMNGEIIEMTEVPDPAFSQKMLGDGFAVKPTDGSVKAPVSGKLVQIFPTNHAFAVVTDEGLEVLVHIGIDTVELKGDGFKRITEPGGEVKAGDVIVEVDLAYLEEKGKPSVTPVVFTNGEKIKAVNVEKGMTGSGPAAKVVMK